MPTSQAEAALPYPNLRAFESFSTGDAREIWTIEHVVDTLSRKDIGLRDWEAVVGQITTPETGGIFGYITDCMRTHGPLVNREESLKKLTNTLLDSTIDQFKTTFESYFPPESTQKRFKQVLSQVALLSMTEGFTFLGKRADAGDPWREYLGEKEWAHNVATKLVDRGGKTWNYALWMFLVNGVQEFAPEYTSRVGTMVMADMISEQVLKGAPSVDAWPGEVLGYFPSSVDPIRAIMIDGVNTYAHRLFPIDRGDEVRGRNYDNRAKHRFIENLMTFYERLDREEGLDGFIGLLSMADEEAKPLIYTKIKERYTSGGGWFANQLLRHLAASAFRYDADLALAAASLIACVPTDTSKETFSNLTYTFLDDPRKPVRIATYISLAEIEADASRNIMHRDGAQVKIISDFNGTAAARDEVIRALPFISVDTAMMFFRDCLDRKSVV